MYHFCTNILKAIFSKRFAFDGICAYFKVGLPALMGLSLCFAPQSLLLAQEPLQNGATKEKLYYFALKNNLIFDDVLFPSNAAEVYFGKQFSLAIEDKWNWSAGASYVWLFENESNMMNSDIYAR